MSEIAKLSANARSTGVPLLGMKRKVDSEVTKIETEREGKENQEVKKQKVCLLLARYTLIAIRIKSAFKIALFPTTKRSNATLPRQTD